MVDVGVSVGTELPPLSALVEPSGSVIAIEAFPPVFDCLHRNIHTHNLNNVTLYNGAISDGPGALVISDDIHSYEKNRILKSGTARDLPVDAPDRLLACVFHTSTGLLAGGSTKVPVL